MLPNHQKRTVKLILLIISIHFIIPGTLAAELSDSKYTGTLSFTETDKSEYIIDEKSDWIIEADRLMDELLALDVKMHTLITSVGNGDSRKALIRQRSINRKLIYDLAIARNAVLEHLGDRY